MVKVIGGRMNLYMIVKGLCKRVCNSAVHYLIKMMYDTRSTGDSNV